MTGLLPERDRIIEIAVVVTDASSRCASKGRCWRSTERCRARRDGRVEQGHARPQRADRPRQGVDHRRGAGAGAGDRVPAAYVPAGKSRRCAATASARTGVSWPHMPRLEAYFHYRNLDVSTLKELARRWKPDILAGFKKAQAHTALADIHESIDELLTTGSISCCADGHTRKNPRSVILSLARAGACSFIPSDLHRVFPAARQAAPRGLFEAPRGNGWRRCRRF